MDKHVHRFSLTVAAASLVATLAAGVRTASFTRAAEPPAMYVCRTAAAGEKANANMTAGPAELVCRRVSLMLKMSGGSLRTIGHATATSDPGGPDLRKALTPQQVNDAYVKFIEQTFHIDHTS
jgi:hypothetical protein